MNETAVTSVSLTVERGARKQILMVDSHAKISDSEENVKLFEQK